MTQLEIENQQLNSELKTEREVCNSYQGNINDLNEQIKQLNQQLLKQKSQYEDTIEQIKDESIITQNSLKDNHKKELNNTISEIEQKYNDKINKTYNNLKERYENEYQERLKDNQLELNQSIF